MAWHYVLRDWDGRHGSRAQGGASSFHIKLRMTSHVRCPSSVPTSKTPGERVSRRIALTQSKRILRSHHVRPPVRPFHAPFIRSRSSKKGTTMASRAALSFLERAHFLDLDRMKGWNTFAVTAFRIRMWEAQSIHWEKFT